MYSKIFFSNIKYTVWRDTVFTYLPDAILALNSQYSRFPFLKMGSFSSLIIVSISEALMLLRDVFEEALARIRWPLAAKMYPGRFRPIYILFQSIVMGYVFLATIKFLDMALQWCFINPKRYILDRLWRDFKTFKSPWRRKCFKNFTDKVFL